MIKGASAKSARGMASTAILGGRHVGIKRGAKWHAACRTCPIRNMTGKAAITHDTSMIKDLSKILSVMAQTTVFGSEALMCCRIRRCYGINTSAGIVA